MQQAAFNKLTGKNNGAWGLELVKSLWNIRDPKPARDTKITEPVNTDIYHVPMRRSVHRFYSER